MSVAGNNFQHTSLELDVHFLIFKVKKEKKSRGKQNNVKHQFLWTNMTASHIKGTVKLSELTVWEKMDIGK